MTQNQFITDPEAKLVRKCQQGDHAAFRVLYEIYKEKVYTFVCYMVSDREVARDLTQDIFIKIYRSIGSFEGSSELRNWIFRLTRNYCIDANRKRNKLRQVFVRASPDEQATIPVREDPHEMLDQLQVSESVKRVILRLRPKLRMVVVLRYINGLSYAEIAEILGCTIGTVSSRLHRSHKILFQKLQHMVE